MVLSGHDKSSFVLNSYFHCSVLVKTSCCYESLGSYSSVAKTVTSAGMGYCVDGQVDSGVSQDCHSFEVLESEVEGQ
jgi:hypothetical protein